MLNLLPLRKLSTIALTVGLLAASSAYFSASAGMATVSILRPADKLYFDADIWTGTSSTAAANTIAVREGRIIGLGTMASLAALSGPNTKKIDLHGAFVVPGFIDNHVHFLDGGASLNRVKLRTAKSQSEVADIIAAFAKKTPKGEWILGGEWDHESWGGQLPTKEWIDTVTPDHPVMVLRLDSHMVLANTVALKLAGIDRNTKSPKGGVIVRDAQGNPTGVLKDAAKALIEKFIPKATATQLDHMLEQASNEAVKNGVTQVHDMGLLAGGPEVSWEGLDTYRRAEATGRLNLRIYSFMPLPQWEKLDNFISANGRGNEMFRWGGLKAFIDGSLGSSTAWFHEAYNDDQSNFGFPMGEMATIQKMALGADKANLQLAIHAIGDKANDALLEVFETIQNTNGKRDRRSRIEHAQHLSAEALTKYQALKITASMQPYHAIDDGRWAEKRIGAERIKRTYAFKSLLDNGVFLTFGSDWYVAPLSPLEGIYAAVTRRTIDGANPDGWIPEQKITVEQALIAYTTSNAYAGFHEKDTGTIEVGKLADFTVLSENILEIPVDDLLKVNILRTVIGGEDKYLWH